MQPRTGVGKIEKPAPFKRPRCRPAAPQFWPRVAAAAMAPGGAFVEEPDELCCPITHCLFCDPVVTADATGGGQTYERHALAKHWTMGRRTDPLTGVCRLLFFDDLSFW